MKRFVHRVRYLCDADPCEAMALAWDDELPEGWTESVVIVVPAGGGKPQPRTEHRCPKCGA